MKTLSILRHAKSSWEFPELNDFDRPLLNKGVKRTLLICEKLNQLEQKPDLIISSPAKRAHETAIIICEKLNIPLQNLISEETFYPGYEKSFRKKLASIDQNISHVMVVGHNPGLTDLAYSFLKDESIDWIPTSGFVNIEFDCKKWKSASEENARLIHYLIPKLLKQESESESKTK